VQFGKGTLVHCRRQLLPEGEFPVAYAVAN
jgi:hypothetical protein